MRRFTKLTARLLAVGLLFLVVSVGIAFTQSPSSSPSGGESSLRPHLIGVAVAQQTPMSACLDICSREYNLCLSYGSWNCKSGHETCVSLCKLEHGN